jgi:hypothetical protein
MMRKQYTVLIPHGFPDDGDSWIHTLQMRQLNGYDELYMREMKDCPLPFRTTSILSRVTNFGKKEESGSDISREEMVRHLTVGDRIALMLHLRRLTFGDKISCTFSCPSCKEVASLDLSISGLLLEPPSQQPRTEYVIEIENFILRVSPVNGAKLEAVFKNDRDKSENAEKLMRSCICYSEPCLPSHKLSDNFLSIVSSKLEELDPQADIVLNFVCPSCQYSYQFPFDAEDFIFQEIDLRQKQLEREVHWLAFNYHWSEHSILSIPVSRRKRYAELINMTLSGKGI